MLLASLALGRKTGQMLTHQPIAKSGSGDWSTYTGGCARDRLQRFLLSMTSRRSALAGLDPRVGFYAVKSCVRGTLEGCKKPIGRHRAQAPSCLPPGRPCRSVTARTSEPSTGSRQPRLLDCRNSGSPAHAFSENFARALRESRISWTKGLLDSHDAGRNARATRVGRR